MKKIIGMPSQETIQYQNVDYDKGIIVCIFNNELSILTERNTNGCYGFTAIKRNEWHSCSDTKIVCVEKNIMSNMLNKPVIYKFDDWQELAGAIIKNGWN